MTRLLLRGRRERGMVTVTLVANPDGSGEVQELRDGARGPVRSVLKAGSLSGSTDEMLQSLAKPFLEKGYQVTQGAAAAKLNSVVFSANAPVAIEHLKLCHPWWVATGLVHPNATLAYPDVVHGIQVLQTQPTPDERRFTATLTDIGDPMALPVFQDLASFFLSLSQEATITAFGSSTSESLATIVQSRVLILPPAYIDMLGKLASIRAPIVLEAAEVQSDFSLCL